ncbi:MAG: hypothetical protein MJ252_19110 [archaeon]|nr:hypothetical protein [archaeon]
MENRKDVKFHNYINIAEEIKEESITIYFFIKTQAFSLYSGSMPDSLNPIYNQFKNELDTYNQKENNEVSKIKKEEYLEFLEKYLPNIKDENNINEMYKAKDILELTCYFGMMDDKTSEKSKIK